MRQGGSSPLIDIPPSEELSMGSELPMQTSYNNLETPHKHIQSS